MSSALLWSGSTIALFAAAVVAQPAGPLPAPSTTAAQVAQALIPAVTVVPVQPAYDPLRIAIDQWDLLRRDGPASFDEIYRFLVAHPGWPAETTLRQRAERLMTSMTPADHRIDYFRRYPPLSSAAKFRLAEAYLAKGRAAEAQPLVREAWTSDGLNAAQEAEVLARFGGLLTPTDHAARVDRLLWSGFASAAERLLPALPADRRAWADARIAFIKNAPDAPSKLSLVPGHFQNDPGLIMDRVQWMRRNNQPAEARQLMANTNISPGTATMPEKWMEERLSLARAAQRDQQYDLAYRLAANHRAFPLGRALNSWNAGERDDYTSIEFLAGWIALKNLNRAAVATDHFQNYRNGALSPLTQARGDYWAGRSAEAAGNAPASRRFLESAATHPDYFFGQLATERLGRNIALPMIKRAAVTPAARQRFAQSELVRAAKLLGERGDRMRQTLFLTKLATDAQTLEEQTLVAELAPALRRPDIGVIVGREARNSGQLALIDAAYPRLAAASPSASDWTMIHAITRQESRFDRAAVSSANARGLMQLMPGTARETASKVGVGYDFTRLTEDEAYNVLLGSTYFRNLLDNRGGNHVLAVASYNAGPGNVNKWIRANGDPRDPNIDVVDWIEAIPFNETRIYVWRVLENAVVYDLLHPGQARMPAKDRLSAYLGKRRPG
ncbi:transglycosylase SLT domain-containing protein [Sphingoaurantiacus capsulatus]|uniref:Transglycosylase SLT domain-containing protein n=1 Tax=Sphingoaurantiacus capsulatus TaxID=1771310 RepID=A0ABV7XE00_9SPHN